MATYRLEYSISDEKLKHRIKKALRAEATEIHCYQFPIELSIRNLLNDMVDFGDKHTEQVTLVWFGLRNEARKESFPNWDKIVFLVNHPNERKQIFGDTHDNVVEIRKRSELETWEKYILESREAQSESQLFFDFQKETVEENEGLRPKDIYNFLCRLKTEMPEWKISRFPGSGIWNVGIPDTEELEASTESLLFDNTLNESYELSVIIPTFNCKYFLSNVIHHLSRQKSGKRRFEIIIVDDGGSDDSFEYLKNSNDLSQVNLKYFYWPRSSSRERGRGIFRAGHCRNLGAKASTGKILTFLDSDIIVGSEFINTIFEGFAAENDVLQFPRKHIFNDMSDPTTQYQNVTESITYIEDAAYWGPFFKSENWEELTAFWKYTCTYALAMTKEDFLEAGRFGHFYVSYGFEDTELGYRLAKLGKKFKLIKEDVFHLTSYSLSEYQLSKKFRFQLLRTTACQFFFNTLDPEVYKELEFFLDTEGSILSRLKKIFLYFR